MERLLDGMTSYLYGSGVARTGAERKSSSDVARDRAAIRDSWPGLVTLVAVQGSLLVLDPDGGASAWNLVWSILPIVPALWLVRAQLRGLARADEYQRTVQLEAMAVGFGVAIVASMTGGLLDAAGIGDSRQSLQVTFIAGTLAWIATLVIRSGRGR
jgi:hypothetical protein